METYTPEQLRDFRQKEEDEKLRLINVAIRSERERCAVIAENAFRSFATQLPDETTRGSNPGFEQYNKIRKKMCAYVASLIRNHGMPK